MSVLDKNYLLLVKHILNTLKGNVKHSWQHPSLTQCSSGNFYSRCQVASSSYILHVYISYSFWEQSCKYGLPFSLNAGACFPPTRTLAPASGNQQHLLKLRIYHAEIRVYAEVNESERQPSRGTKQVENFSSAVLGKSIATSIFHTWDLCAQKASLLVPEQTLCTWWKLKIQIMYFHATFYF